LLGTTAETAARSNDKTSTSANGKAGEVTTLLARENPWHGLDTAARTCLLL
jgi:hypothetical protein